MKRLPVAKDWVSLFAILFAFGSVYLAMRSLDRNSAGLVGNIRGQIYAGDRSLYARENAEAGGRLNSIYAAIDPKGMDVKSYIRARLRLLAPTESDPLLVNVKNADELYNALFGPEVYLKRPFPLAGEFYELRKAELHVEEYFYHLAAVHDYRREGILKPGEWLTWRAWFANVGPHPLLLTAIYNALDEGYIGRDYAFEVRDALCGNDPETKRIVREFLGPKYGPAFVDGSLDFLPKY